MQLTIPNKLNAIPRNAMRQCGYFENYDRRSEQVSYIRSLTRSRYPRFHIYIKEHGDNLLFNLHIDQKQASYEGHTAHSGEYDSDLVLREGERLKQILARMVVARPSIQKEEEDEDESASAEAAADKKGFFGRLFGR